MDFGVGWFLYLEGSLSLSCINCKRSLQPSIIYSSNIMGEIDEKTPIDSQDFTSYTLMKIHAATVGYATSPASSGWMPERTFMPIPPFQFSQSRFFCTLKAVDLMQAPECHPEGSEGQQGLSQWCKLWWRWEDVQAPRLRFW